MLIRFSKAITIAKYRENMKPINQTKSLKKSMKQSRFLKEITPSKRKNVQKAKLYILSTQNNTHITITDFKGKTKASYSAGSLGFKNARKSTIYAANMVAEKAARTLQQLGFVFLNIYIKGLGYAKEATVRHFKKYRISILKIEDNTPVPYNGCRVAKKRRI